jgi:hypothetical protein
MDMDRMWGKQAARSLCAELATLEPGPRASVLKELLNAFNRAAATAPYNSGGFEYFMGVIAALHQYHHDTEEGEHVPPTA